MRIQRSGAHDGSGRGELDETIRYRPKVCPVLSARAPLEACHRPITRPRLPPSPPPAMLLLQNRITEVFHGSRRCIRRDVYVALSANGGIVCCLAQLMPVPALQQPSQAASPGLVLRQSQKQPLLLQHPPLASVRASPVSPCARFSRQPRVMPCPLTVHLLVRCIYTKQEQHAAPQGVPRGRYRRRIRRGQWSARVFAVILQC